MSGEHRQTDYIQHYALLLKRAEPDAYEHFIKHFDAYATETAVAITEAPATEILNMQGRAKQTLAIVHLLSNPKPISKT